MIYALHVELNVKAIQNRATDALLIAPNRRLAAGTSSGCVPEIPEGTGLGSPYKKKICGKITRPFGGADRPLFVLKWWAYHFYFCPVSPQLAKKNPPFGAHAAPPGPRNPAPADQSGLA